MIRERVQSGISRAQLEEADPQGIKRRRRQGKQAHGRPSVLSDKLKVEIRLAKELGKSYRAIAEQFGVSLGTVQNALKIS
jgi:DNA invertase Pin-like site-specific DNA recombinase